MTKAKTQMKPLRMRKRDLLDDIERYAAEGRATWRKIEKHETTPLSVKHEVRGWHELTTRYAREASEDMRTGELFHLRNQAGWALQMLRAGAQWAPQAALE